MGKIITTLNPSAKILKQHLQSEIRKATTLKDIHNMKPKMTSSNNTLNALCDLLQDVANKGKVLICLNSENEFEAICFATMDMIATYTKYPEVLFLDGTYKINRHGYPLYQFMVQDNIGRGRAVFYAFVQCETSAVLKRVLDQLSTDSLYLLFVLSNKYCF